LQPKSSQQQSQPKNVRRCALAIRTIPPSCYRLPSDGRQWQSQCRLRLQLAQLLASYANPDGGSIKISVPTMVAALEISRSVVFELLADLKELGFLTDAGKSQFSGTTARTLQIDKMRAALNGPELGSNSPELAEGVPRVSPPNSPELAAQPSGTGLEFRTQP
jgi:hypothetical protein